MPEIQEGHLVEFQTKKWWVHDIKFDWAVIIPEEDWDAFEQVLRLNRAIKVNRHRLKLVLNE